MRKKTNLLTGLIVVLFFAVCVLCVTAYKAGENNSNSWRDPTYVEVKEFSELERVYYILRPDICLDLAIELRDELHEKGFRSGIAHLYGSGYAHTVIVFDPVDEDDLVYIDWVPQRIEGTAGFILQEVKVRIGESYTRLNGLEYPGFDDTIQAIKIIW